jgi:hypothetical protein
MAFVTKSRLAAESIITASDPPAGVILAPARHAAMARAL